MSSFKQYLETHKVNVIGSIRVKYINYSKLTESISSIHDEITKGHLIFDSYLNNSEILLDGSQLKTSDDWSWSVDPNQIEIITPSSSLVVENELQAWFQSRNGQYILKFTKELEQEIKNFYISYWSIEKYIYKLLNSQVYIQDNYNEFNYLQLASKLKEFKDILGETITFCDYISLNMNSIKHILRKLDKSLSPLYNQGYLSYKIIKGKIESPGSDWSYMLQFKWIDEVSCILGYLYKKIMIAIKNLKINKRSLKQSILLNSLEYSSFNNSNDNMDTSRSFISNKDKDLWKSFEQVIDSSQEEDTLTILNNIRENTQKTIRDFIYDIDNNNSFRAKFVNLSILIRYGFREVKNNMNVSGLRWEDESASQAINCLMDEELMIKKFISKKRKSLI